MFNGEWTIDTCRSCRPWQGQLWEIPLKWAQSVHALHVDVTPHCLFTPANHIKGIRRPLLAWVELQKLSIRFGTTAFHPNVTWSFWTSLSICTAELSFFWGGAFCRPDWYNWIQLIGLLNFPGPFAWICLQCQLVVCSILGLFCGSVNPSSS